VVSGAVGDLIKFQLSPDINPTVVRFMFEAIVFFANVINIPFGEN